MFFACILFIPPQIFAQEEETQQKDVDLAYFQQWSVEERKERLADITEIPLVDQKITLEIGKDSDIRVTHEIKSGFWGANNPKIIQVLPGIHTNLHVTDIDGDTYPFFWEDETFEESEYVILQSKLSQFNLLVSYDLKNYLELTNDGIWGKEIKISTDVELIFDDDIKQIFVNTRPIDITNADGISCGGCELFLEFWDNDSPLIKNILINDKQNEVKIWSNGKISDFGFNEKINEIHFITEKNNQKLVLEIPLNVILYPFTTYLTDIDDDVLDQEDKIFKSEFSHNETHVKLSLNPENIGRISIIGATQAEYENLLSKINERNIVEEVVKEDETFEESDLEEVIEDNGFSDWNTSQNNANNDGLFYGIVGIIIAIIIVGIIIKLKK